MTKEFEGLDEVAHRAAEAVKGGDDHDVDPPRFHFTQEAFQGGPLLLCPGDALVDEFDRLRTQIAELRLAGLVRRADARVDRHALRGQLHAMAMLCINAKQSIGGWVARRGRPIAPAKGRKGKRISFLLEDDVYRPLAHHCIDADMTIQRFVVEAIREKLARAHSGQ